MSDHEARTYGDRIADVYDEWFPHALLQTDASIERLVELAGRGPLLELGIGTGRVTVPLAQRGLEVHGIEASEAMAAKLRAKPGGELVHLTVGDIAEADVDGSFSLVFAIGDTLNLLATQEQQLRCLRRFAAKLVGGGVFVVEGIVHAEAPPSGSVKVAHVDADEVRLLVTESFPGTQELRAAHVVLGTEGVRIIPVFGRTIPPAELDLMAALAGLRLRERWGGWEREPFTPQSRRHVSIYEPVESA
jgi:SAM-dependent methyltransferase